MGAQSATALWGRAFRPLWGRSRWSLYGVRFNFLFLILNFIIPLNRKL